jgi:hypothetical protein
VNYDNSYVEPSNDPYYNFAENGGYEVNFDFDNKKITASKTSEPIELNIVDIMDYGYEEGLVNVQKFLSDYNFGEFNHNNDNIFQYQVYSLRSNHAETSF